LVTSSRHAVVGQGGPREAFTTAALVTDSARFV
jgi:hypothetical protein